MTRRIGAAALSGVLTFLVVISGFVFGGSDASAASSPTVVSGHSRVSSTVAERRPGAALTQAVAQRQAPGWAPLDPPVSDLPTAGWSAGLFLQHDLVHVAGFGVVTAGPVLRLGRSPPVGASTSESIAPQ